MPYSSSVAVTRSLTRLATELISSEAPASDSASSMRVGQRGEVAGGERRGDLVEPGEILHGERQHGQRLVPRRAVGIDGLDRRPGQLQGEHDVALAVLLTA